MSRSQNFLEEGEEEEEAIHHNVLPLNKKQFIVQNFMFLGSYHKLYMTLLFRISFRKKKENESSWAEVGRAIYGWFQTIFVSLSPRTLGKMNIGLEKKLHHHLVIKDRDPNQPWGSGERWRELLVPAGEDFCAVLSMMENGPWHHRSESWHESATLHLVTYGVSPNGIVCLLSFTVFQQWSRLLCFT